MDTNLPQTLAALPAPLADARRVSLARLGEVSPADISVSFEFFPPKSDKAEQQLWHAVETLAPLRPRFMSVTYGAGGTTRQRTHETVIRLQTTTGVPAAAHLTCIGSDRAEIDEIADRYWQAGIRHIVALRGDPPAGPGTSYQPVAGGYDYADALVLGLRRLHDFEISVAAYPETHPAAPSDVADLDHLKRKLDAGATRAITQFFFDTDSFLRFRDRAIAAGITAPLVPGIFPIGSFERACRFAESCGATIPPWMARAFDGLDSRPELLANVAAAFAAEQCRALLAEGARAFHFYTLNRPELTLAACHLMGLRAADATAD